VHALYELSVWLHILAMTVWLGGMFFLVLVVVPWLRTGDRMNAAALIQETGERFRTVGWVALLLAFATGVFNLWRRGVGLSDLLRPAWRASPMGRAVLWKLALFTSVLLVSAVHDFNLGPRATNAMQLAPDSPRAQGLRRTARWMGRVNMLLGLALVALGVILVRGWPT